LEQVDVPLGVHRDPCGFASNHVFWKLEEASDDSIREFRDGRKC
jgi:hypothetical protein